MKLGRAMGCMMTDDIVARVAFKAQDQYILADEIDEFLSQSLIVPPGKWDQNSRWEPNEDMQPAKRPCPALMEWMHDHRTDNEKVEETGGLQYTGKIFGGTCG